MLARSLYVIEVLARWAVWALKLLSFGAKCDPIEGKNCSGEKELHAGDNAT